MKCGIIVKYEKCKNVKTPLPNAELLMQDDDEEFVEQEGNVCCVGEVF